MLHFAGYIQDILKSVEGQKLTRHCFKKIVIPIVVFCLPVFVIAAGSSRLFSSTLIALCIVLATESTGHLINRKSE